MYFLSQRRPLLLADFQQKSQNDKLPAFLNTQMECRKDEGDGEGGDGF